MDNEIENINDEKIYFLIFQQINQKNIIMNIKIIKKYK